MCLADRSRWSKYEPLPLPAGIRNDFPALAESIRLTARGEVADARAVIAETKGSPAVRDWYIKHGQQSGFCRWTASAKGAKQPGGGQRDRLAYPRRAVERQVFKANHHHCVYCQPPVISGEMLKAFRTIVGPSIFGMGTSNAETHGLVFAHRAVADHLDPRSNGGRTDLENLVTACYACNFGKAQFTLAEIGLEQPRASIEAGWDGLESLRNELSARARADAKAR